MAITKRASLGRPLTHTELDNNQLSCSLKDENASVANINFASQYSEWRFNDTSTDYGNTSIFGLYNSSGIRGSTLTQYYTTGSMCLGDSDGNRFIAIRNGTNYMFFNCNNNNEFGITTTYSASWGNHRAPVFYDSNNTSLYLDPSSTGTSLRTAGYVTAYYSDERLKDNHGNLPNALDKVKSLNGFYYTPNEKAQKLGYKNKKQVGVSAQEVEAILPEIVTEAAVGRGYKTVKYDRLVPLLIEAVKELKSEVESLEEVLEGK